MVLLFAVQNILACLCSFAYLQTLDWLGNIFEHQYPSVATNSQSNLDVNLDLGIIAEEQCSHVIMRPPPCFRMEVICSG